MIFVIFIVVAILLWVKKVSDRHKKLKCFVSPPGRPIFKHLHLFESKHMLSNFMNIIKQYGGLLRLDLIYGKDALLVADKDFISFLLKSTTILNKNEIYRHTRKWLATGLLTSDREKWEKQRKIITPAFRIQILEEYVSMFYAPTETLIQKLKLIQPSDHVDIFSFLQLCTLDIICETAMGVQIHAQENKCPDYVYSIKEECRILMERNRSIYKYLDIFYFFTKDYWKERKTLKVLHGFTRNILERKRREKINNSNQMKHETRKNLSFLDLLLEYSLEEHLITDENIMEEVDTFMFAGHDTTASGTSFALYCLSKHPDVQKKVYEEQKLIFGNDTRPPTYQDLQEMKYLEMAIKESLRLYPPVPFIGREPHNDTVYGDSVIPKNSSIIIFTYGLHRNPLYFPDPEEYKPERFESNIEPFSYMPFSAGIRNCIGQRFAMLEMKYLISRIVREFEICCVPDYTPQLVPDIVLISSNGVRISLKSKVK